MAEPNTTVCVLLYGNYPELAKKCLDPLMYLWKEGKVHLRIGGNAISADTWGVVAGHLNGWHVNDNKKIENLEVSALVYPSGASADKAAGPVVIDISPKNRFKYPVMRSLFHNHLILDTPWTSWFDDDSYIMINPDEWLAALESAMPRYDMVGRIHHIRYMPGQEDWQKDHCPWHRGIPTGGKCDFATGGWWAIRSELLRTYDWPHRDLTHRGGDVLLGELCRQQKLRLGNYEYGLLVNAGDSGKHNDAEKRGVSATETPIGKGYKRVKR